MDSSDNSLQINIEAVDDASGVLQGVADAAAEMADSLSSVAQEANGALENIGTAAETMSSEVIDASAASGESMTAMGSEFLAASEEALAIGTSFDDAAAMVLGANEEIETSNDTTKASTALMAGSLLLVSNQLKGLASDVTGEIKTAYSETGNWNQSLVILAQLLKNTGSSIPQQELVDFTKKMQDTTLFQQESVLQSENMVMAHKNLQPSYQSIISLSADLATKMADSSGGVANLSNATKLLTNAMTDPVTALMLLKQANVDLDPAVIKAIQTTAKAGDTAAASALLMKSLQSSIGGLAITADTASGTGFTKLQNNITSMQQNMPTLTSDLDKLANTLNSVLTPLAAFVNDHPTLTANVLLATAAILSIAAALTGFAAQILLLRFAFVPMLPYLATFAEFVGDVIVAALGLVSAPLLLLIGLVILLALVWVTQWKAIKDGAMIVWDAMKTGFGDAVSWLENLFSGWFTKVMGWINSIISAMQNIGKSIGGTVSGAGSAIGGFIGSIPKLFAEGGIVTSPTLGIIGEAGPEAVIPLSAFAGGSSLAGSGFGGGSGAINVYVTGQVLTTEQQAKTLGDMIARQINRQLKLQSFR